MPRGTFWCIRITGEGGAVLMFAVKLAKNLKISENVFFIFFRLEKSFLGQIGLQFFCVSIKMVSSKKFVQRNTFFLGEKV